MVGVSITDPVVHPAIAAPPTLAHVATLAGVSPATASRALTGSARVSPQARIRVEQAAQRLGYVRHRVLTHLSDPSGSVAAVICEDSARVFGDPFFSRVLWGINRELSGGPQLVVLMLNKTDEWRTVADYLRGGHASGVLLISMHRSHPLAMLRATAGVPVVLAGRPPADTQMPYVDADNRGGAQAAVEHLLRSGRQVIGTIAGPQDMGVGGDRLAGYRTAIASAGLATVGLIAHGDFREMSGEHAMNRLLDRRPDLDAVLVASDLMAVGAMRALHRAGRRVPDDVAVIGFDDAPLAQKIRPRLTTVRQPVEDMGTRMARELLARMAGKTSSDQGVVLKTKLIIRDSA
ncbi:MAG: transcriptional regulator, LacI family [Actinomycetia bacterium]|jgi:DNA-binding LacI/PurR family transcriptional regulator|nr:transcriptional regulator, LacI family [Actinomycetes bacterium]